VSGECLTIEESFDEYPTPAQLETLVSHWEGLLA